MFNILASSAINTNVQSWSNRVQKNGGAMPSANTQRALSNFLQGLEITGLKAKMKSINCFVPDSLIAALTPLLIGNGGNDPWTNNGGFVSGDLTINGLAGDNVGKYLNTGLTPQNISTYPRVAVTYYVTAFGVGTSPFGTTYIEGGYPLIQNNIGSTNYLLDFPIESGVRCRINVGNTDLGYFCNSRTATNLVTVYKANSSVAHTTLGTNALAPDGDYFAPNTYPYFVHAVNIVGVAKQFSDHRLSFMSFHDGVSAAESARFFPLVQTLRQQLGGGYI